MLDYTLDIYYSVAAKTVDIAVYPYICVKVCVILFYPLAAKMYNCIDIIVVVCDPHFGTSAVHMARDMKNKTSKSCAFNLSEG